MGAVSPSSIITPGRRLRKPEGDVPAPRRVGPVRVEANRERGHAERGSEAPPRRTWERGSALALLSPRLRDPFPVRLAIARVELGDLDRLVGGNSMENLGRFACRPVDFQAATRFRAGQADGLLQGVGPEAAAG